MGRKYSCQGFESEKMARAVGKDLPISTKQSIEICNFIRRKPVNTAKKILNGAINKKKAIPFKRFNMDMGHKKGKIGAGRYPVKSCEHILALLKSAEANANQKGLDNLKIAHICANRGAQTWHYGRQSRIKMKRTNLEIVVEQGKPEIKEQKIEKKKPIEKKEVVEEKK